MARSIRTRIGIVVVCVVALAGSMGGAIQAARSYTPGLDFVLPGGSGENRDCADFRGRFHARWVFDKHGGPDEDPGGLDPDGDGKPCEHFRYRDR